MQDYKKVIQFLYKEYQFFKDHSLKVERQFQSESSRIYNTFLIKSDLPDFENFVAKGPILKKYTLKGEWKILNLLKTKNYSCPQLLVLEHEPANYLLLKYINGQKASERLLKNINRTETFSKMGELISELHTFEVIKFGNLDDKININWGAYLNENTQSRLTGCRNIISDDLCQKSKKLLVNLRKIIDFEGQNPPVLIHRDIYSDNFIFRKNPNKLFLIDYGMAIGGRPFYDLGKFYIFDLYRFPEYKNDFLNGYQRNIKLPMDFNEYLKLYILRELLGCVNFFSTNNQIKNLNLIIKILGELVSETGIITKLIS